MNDHTAPLRVEPVQFRARTRLDQLKDAARQAGLEPRQHGLDRREPGQNRRAVRAAAKVLCDPRPVGGSEFSVMVGGKHRPRFPAIHHEPPPVAAPSTAAIRGIELELKSKKQGNMPQLLLQLDNSMKVYTGQKYKNDFDSRAMLTLSYKFMDGGLADAQLEQTLARLDQEQQRYDFDRDEAEARFQAAISLEPLGEEEIPLSEFTAGEDEITRQVIEYGGLFPFNVARMQGK